MEQFEKTQYSTKETVAEPPEEALPRRFGFFKDGDVKREVAVKPLGALAKLKENTPTKESAWALERVESVVSVFENARVPHQLPNGKTIVRRPHLLIAGGFVRDMLLGKTPKDIDFATNLDYETTAGLLEDAYAEEIRNGAVEIVGKKGQTFGVMRLYFKNPETGDVLDEYEIAMFREEEGYSDGRRPDIVTHTRHPGRDADRRDLTVNALFYNPRSGNVIDYVGGLDDIRDKKLRFVGDPEERIAEDKLRILRYVRFLQKTGFEAEERAKEAVLAHAEDLSSLPRERIGEELDKLFGAHKNVGDGLRLLEEYALLDKALPDVARLRDCPQGYPYHMEGDGLEHTFGVANGLPEDASPELRWAAVLHDIGKPDTRSEDPREDGVHIQFLKHENYSAERAQELLRLFSSLGKEGREKILFLIKEHIRIFRFPYMGRGKALALVQSPHFDDLVHLAAADTRASKGASIEIDEEHEALLVAIAERARALREELEAQGGAYEKIRKALNGNRIMERFEELHGRTLNPKKEGRLIGEIKTKALDEAAERGITDVGEALELLDGIISEHGD